MTLHFKNKFKAQKKYIAFFTIVPMLIVTALIQMPCPVCEGTGSISNTGMGEVRITNIKEEITGVYTVSCLATRVYITDIALTMQNDGAVDGNGYVSMVLIDYKKGRVLDNQLVQVNVPSNMQVDAFYTIFFQVSIDDPKTIQVNAKVLSDDVPDEACDGKGGVALNSWPVFNILKDRFMDAQTLSTVKPVFQPLFLPPEDWEEPEELIEFDIELTEEAE